jgi:hypothetical protein
MKSGRKITTVGCGSVDAAEKTDRFAIFAALLFKTE